MIELVVRVDNQRERKLVERLVKEEMSPLETFWPEPNVLSVKFNDSSDPNGVEADALMDIWNLGVKSHDLEAYVEDILGEEETEEDDDEEDDDEEEDDEEDECPDCGDTDCDGECLDDEDDEDFEDDEDDWDDDDLDEEEDEEEDEDEEEEEDEEDFDDE